MAGGDLLERLAPLPRYDLLEGDQIGRVEDLDAVVCRADGSEITAFTPAVVSAGRYPDGSPVDRTDYLRIRSRKSGPAKTYGLVVEQGTATFLVYWWWYPMNGFHWSTGGWHHGDWESVVIRVRGVAPDRGPDLAAYARHRTGEARRWDRVRRVDGRPLVFVALGSHAAYFDRGPLATGRRAPDPPELERVAPETHPWLLWPGRWGQSRTGGRWADSPRGPLFHEQTRNPGGWIAGLLDPTAA
jgi:hypothetical protein